VLSAKGNMPELTSHPWAEDSIEPAQ